MATNFLGGGVNNGQWFNESTGLYEAAPLTTTPRPTFGDMSPENAVKKGLGGAGGLITSQPSIDYPNYVPSQGQAPVSEGFYNYTPNQPMAQIQTPNYKINTNPPAWNNFSPSAENNYERVNTQVSAQPWNFQSVNPNAQAAGYNWQGNQFQKLGTSPTYEGLMGGDYDAFQKALSTPGEIAATRAYSQGQNNLTNQMGGQGLYGSSIMSNQARTALEQPYMETMATNAAQAAAQRYQQQAADLQNKNQFGLNVYGQQMGESQAANQFGLQQGLAQNAAGLDYSKLLTGVNQQNVSNALAQNTQANQLGLDYAQSQTAVGESNATRTLQQAATMNALKSGDTQQLNNLMAQQNLARNSFGTDIYGKQLAQEQNMNAYGLDAAKLGMTQNQNVYNAGVADAARQQDYSAAGMDYRNTQTEAQRQWQNAQALEQFQYQLAQGQYGNQQNTQNINQYLALAGLGAPLAAANQTNATNSQNGWLGAIGGLLGSYLGS